MKTKATGIQYTTAPGGDFDLKVTVRKDASGKILSGLVLGATLEQNMACLLVAEPGDYKGDLDLGVGIRSALLGEDMLGYRHQIKEQFAKDGLIVKHLDFYNLQNVQIDAEYE